ncbi:MAG: formate dehydrogenase subunit gamma [Azospirillum sp.]|nr:formate dehydrogenase subunit gamma [Azospirillum sp.]
MQAATRRKPTAFGRILVLLGALLLPLALTASGTAETPEGLPPTMGPPQGNLLMSGNQAEMWRAVRMGISGRVSILDEKAGTLVQSGGEDLRAFRNGPLSSGGGWLLLASVLVVSAFFAYRGRIKIDRGKSGRTVERFTGFERLIHWVMACSFIVLALTGLNMLYGKHVLLPLLGPVAFAELTQLGKYSHNYIAFAFMASVAVMFVMWVSHNLPDRLDVQWLAKGGGLFAKGVHPPAKKFNAGQKVIFWAVVLGGFSIAFSGICLLLPFEIHPFAATFKILNLVGFALPTDLSPLQETQLALLWHGIMALLLIAVIIGHIYIGSLGMQGALAAVTSGQVDENWAREHHSLWLAEHRGEKVGGDD